MKQRSTESRLKEIKHLLLQLLTKEQTIMENQDQEALDIQAMADQVKVIISGIQALETALTAAGNTTPAVDTALANLKANIADATALLPAALAPTPTPAPAPEPALTPTPADATGPAPAPTA